MAARSMTPADDDDDDFELWIEKSEAEQDAELQALIRESNERFDAMTPLQLYRWRRRQNVDLCLRWRRLIDKMDLEIFREHLRKAQKRLLEIRTARSTGATVGHS